MASLAGSKAAGVQGTSGNTTVSEPWDSQTLCNKCHVILEDKCTWIKCDICDLWFHQICVGVDVLPNVTVEWKCDECKLIPVTSTNQQPPTTIVPGDGIDPETASGSIPSKTKPKKPEKAPKGTVPKSPKVSKASVVAYDEELALVDEILLLKQQRLELLRQRRATIQLESPMIEAPASFAQVTSLYAPAVSYQLPSIHVNNDYSHIAAKSGMERVSPQFPQSHPMSLNARQTDVTYTRSQMQQPIMHSVESGRRDNSANNSLSDSETVERMMRLMTHQYLIELPTFSGNPEEFPAWIAAYESTTRDGGYGDADNLLRLQKCLQGEAKALVQARLYTPAGVADTIAELKEEYGSPRAIICKIKGNLAKLPSLNENNAYQMKAFYNVIKNSVGTLLSIGDRCYVNSPFLVDEIEQRFPDNLKRQWRTYVRKTLTNSQSYGLDDLCKWLKSITEWITIEDVERSKAKSTKTVVHRVNYHVEADGEKNSVVAVGNTQTPDKSPKNKTEKQFDCVFCKRNGHKTQECRRFMASSLEDRRKFVKNKALCFLCLSIKHRASNCPEEGLVCGVDNCEAKHHASLHVASDVNNNKEKKQIVAAVHNADSTVTYRIVPVELTHNGRTLKMNAFLDSGSSVTLISADVASQLGLAGTPEHLCTVWTDDTTRVDKSSTRTQAHVSGVHPNAKKYKLHDLRTVQTLNLPVPTDPKTIQHQYEYIRDIKFPEFNNDKPKLLIGLLDSWLTVSLETRMGSYFEPVATRTKLGWALQGRVPSAAINIPRCCVTCEVLSDQQMHDLVNSFFTAEAAGMVQEGSTRMSKESERALKILETKTRKVEDRFETGLLWKQDVISLPNNYETALRRLVCLEKRMESDPALKAIVNGKIDENVSKGYARLLTSEEASKRTSKTWYLPIFPVTNPHKPGKVRIVYDAAAKSAGVCLNDFLLTGPDLLSSLTSVLSKHREFRVAISGDIREMFHRVLINVEDQQAQRFLWRTSPDKPPSVYVMQVMTFGATCSPTTSQFVKNYNATQHQARYPRAAEAIINRHYMDDLLDSFSSEEEAIRVAQEVVFVHQQAGMEIRDFKSNSKQVMRVLNKEEPDYPEDIDLSIQSETFLNKVLGMYWNLKADTYTYKLSFVRVDPALIEMKRVPTKREVLRIVMSIFDPLGLVANVVVYAKILLKEIWMCGVEWDQPLPDELYTKWQKWFSELKVLSTVSVPRCYSALIPRANDIQLHVFVDASKDAFAAVAYFRIQQGDSVEVALIRAKTRVAPKKQKTIPRLELQAAVLGVQLKQLIANEHSIKADSTHYWSDSQTVLKWIRSENRRFNTYVAHRIEQIQEQSDVGQWRWVPGKQNVADDGTKWDLHPDLSLNGRWFGGPLFIRQPPEQWPVKCPETTSGPLEEEIAIVNVLQEKSRRFEFIDVDRFSKWSRVLRATAWMFRFINKLKLSPRSSSATKQRRDKAKPPVKDMFALIPELTAEELESAEKLLIKKTQWESYEKEIESLLAKNEISKSSPIRKLSPIMDEDGFLRLRGRIDAAPMITNQQKRPLILNRHHPITQLILLAFHCRFQHQGLETVVNAVRQTYWIPDLRVAVRSTKKRCQWCRVHYAKPVIPEMSPLPPDRLAAFEPPFSHVGIDFFGPIEVAVKRSREKRWGIIFTCLVIRGVHLDVVHKMDTSSCIMAIRKFICTYGTPKTIRCDRGTNLRGAEAELRKSLAEIEPNELMKGTERLTPGHPRIKWRFNPGAAPHMGGAWERLVRSVKTVLYHLMWQHPSSLHDDSLRNFLAEAADVVNSRPLTYRSLESSEDEAITPNHLLRLSGIVNAAPGEFKETNYRQRWKHVQSLADQFWRKWLNEYTPELTRRSKWFDKVQEVQVGDLVLVVDPDAPRNTWRKGRIIQTFPSADGHVRSVRVQVEKTTLLRPVAKIAVLNTNPEE